MSWQGGIESGPQADLFMDTFLGKTPEGGWPPGTVIVKNQATPGDLMPVGSKATILGGGIERGKTFYLVHWQHLPANAIGMLVHDPPERIRLAASSSAPARCWS